MTIKVADPRDIPENREYITYEMVIPYSRKCKTCCGTGAHVHVYRDRHGHEHRAAKLCPRALDKFMKKNTDVLVEQPSGKYYRLKPTV